MTPTIAPVQIGQLNEPERNLDSFYGQFPYPWPPLRFDRIADRSLYRRLLCQDVGDYALTRLPQAARIWVAGCGTNQALFMALRFPDAAVLGTDASGTSLDICAQNASQLGVDNLTLRQEGITQASAEDRFDYIVCTGVIHHNPDPAQCLARLAAALRPDGVLELMVYNRFHRREQAAFRQAVHILGSAGRDSEELPSHERRWQLARRLARALPPDTELAQKLSDADTEPVNAWADTWIHPCETDYTVAELGRLAGDCGLVMETPVVNQFDRAADTFLWHISLGDEELQARCDGLADQDRWHFVNVLLLDRSPMLWFYLSPADRRRTTEAERNEAFLSTVFDRTQTWREGFVIDESRRYVRSGRSDPFPCGLPHPDLRPIYAAVDGVRPMRAIFADVGVVPTFAAVYRARAQLTTTTFPFLTARPQLG